jgi:putative transposase
MRKIEYKAAAVGIKVVYTEESYTSKASFLDRDPLDGSRISGKRVHRGLYQASDGRLINADVNGSCNIGRKVLESGAAPQVNQDGEFLARLDRSLAARPERIDALSVFSNDRI